VGSLGRERGQVRLAATRGEEFALLSERIRSWLAAGLEPGAIGVTARSGGLVREAREALEADGLDTTSVSVRRGTAGVRAGTMHAMKGLEFQAVAVIGVEEGVVPDPTAITANDEDPLAHAQDLQRERCVLFVACTRARELIPRHSSSALPALTGTSSTILARRCWPVSPRKPASSCW
jgi:superfamily I DNA/RNA helicase